MVSGLAVFHPIAKESNWSALKFVEENNSPSQRCLLTFRKINFEERFEELLKNVLVFRKRFENLLANYEFVGRFIFVNDLNAICPGI